MIVARGLGRPGVGAIVAFGLGLAGTVVVEPPQVSTGGDWTGLRKRARLERLARIERDDQEILEFLTLFLHASGD